MKYWCLIVCCVLGISLTPAYAQSTQQRPQTDERLRDVEFGVSTRQLGLQRLVRMYQWQREGDDYRRVWSEQLIDSGDYPASRRNPERMPIATRYWVAQQVHIDQRPVDEEIFKRFGQWRDFRPNFSALPGNLSATFQPEGNGLGSAENPLAPQVGDLRIIWREMTLPALDGRIALENGHWVPLPHALVPAHPATSAQPAAQVATTQAADKPQALQVLQRYWGALIVFIVLVSLLFRHRWRA